MKKNYTEANSCSLRARNTCEINSLLVHLNDATIQLKFPTFRDRNLSQNVFVLADAR